MRLPRPAFAAVVGLVLVALAGVWLVTLRPAPRLEVTASFTDTTGLYVGNEVSLLGVPVGEVSEIEPRGRTVEVTMLLDRETPLPADVGAVIMQSSLVADRYVELTPAYDGGRRLSSGDHLPTDRTRSPANIDDVTGAINELVVALDETTPGGRDIGDLISVSADALDGQGRRIRDGLVSAEAALRTVNGKEDDLVAVTENLDALVTTLARRDRLIRRFRHNVTASTGVLAGQREEMHETLRALEQLSRVMTRFVRDNRALVRDDLREAATLVEQVAAHEADLAETFDLAPLVAENIGRAFDPETRRLRIKVDVRETGPFSDLARSQICRDLGVPACDLLLNKDGSGLLDPVLDLATLLFPEAF